MDVQVLCMKPRASRDRYPSAPGPVLDTKEIRGNDSRLVHLFAHSFNKEGLNIDLMRHSESVPTTRFAQLFLQISDSIPASQTHNFLHIHQFLLSRLPEPPLRLPQPRPLKY